MQLTIRYNKNRKISEGVRSRIDAKMEHIGHYLEEDHPVHVVLRTEGKGEFAEVSFHFRGHDIFAKSTGKTLYEVIDTSIEHAGRQLDKIVGKSKNRKGQKSLKDFGDLVG